MTGSSRRRRHDRSPSAAVLQDCMDVRDVLTVQPFRAEGMMAAWLERNGVRQYQGGENASAIDASQPHAKRHSRGTKLPISRWMTILLDVRGRRAKAFNKAPDQVLLQRV
jgi:hypothetical protein